MDRREAKVRLQMLLTDRCSRCRYGDKKCTQDCEFERAVNMAIESLSAEQKEEELAKDIARQMATIIENEQDMRVILKNASAEPTDLISRKELLDRIKAVNSIPWGDDRGNAVKLVWSTEEVKRLIEKAPSAETPTFQQKHQLSEETPTDLISRADAMGTVQDHFNTDGFKGYDDGQKMMDRIKALPSAGRPTVSDCWGCNCPKMEREQYTNGQTELLKDGTLKVKTDNGAEVKRVLVWGDDMFGGLYYADDRPSGEWILEDEYGDLWVCAQCGFANEHNDNYCPNCGAKMGGNK